MKKLPEITLLFWCLKICATTLGETAGDLLSMTLNIGYAASSIVLFGAFLIALIAQLSVKHYVPPIYWAVILATSTVGTTLSDYMDRTLGLGYATGSLILASLLGCTLLIWRKVEGSLSVTDIRARRNELFYWAAILCSNTLGTALGDYLADSSGLGFTGGAVLIASILLVDVLAHYFTRIPSVFLFWIAFVLTRPFGATFGDMLTKSQEKGGLDLGTQGSSLVLFTLLVVLVIVAWRRTHTAPSTIAT
ncbi:MAG TPA: hypothetical protein PL010_14510 [Flavobacteriales bacterium]|jgi:uncharacterized membrane-anchored protein|nr:hypothetical protein [Flavobacteriales bacterium]HMW97702.1 hypothetical protein [Flavobacteriales bacterium]HNA34242.1 hypothetical protein [Flavobacteriales bacterium]HNI05832.1 hypothetical protein [Flavobacteriales bacterium]HNK41929.1 hypothetical protein [Flavobacteriales bacterium]